MVCKILQARLQQYMNQELPDVQTGFRKGRGTRDQIANIHWIIEKAREFQKNNYFCFIDYAKAFHCVDHKKLWKILQKMGIPDYLTCVPRNLYAVQEATVKTEHGTTDWFITGKGIWWGCGLLQWLSSKESAYNVEATGDMGLITGSGRSSGGGHSNPLQYSCLESPMDRGAWRATLKVSQRVGLKWLSTARQGCILSPCLFNLYAGYIMRNARLDEAQAGIKILGEISITSDMQMTPPLWQKAKKH